MSRYGSANKNQILIGPDIYDLQILDGLLVVAILPGHFFALGNLGRPCATSDGTRNPIRIASVGLSAEMKPMPFGNS